MKVEREKAIQWIAGIICLVEGIEPIDANDGSPNWWIYQDIASRTLDEVRGDSISRQHQD